MESRHSVVGSFTVDENDGRLGPVGRAGLLHLPRYLADEGLQQPGPCACFGILGDAVSVVLDFQHCAASVSLGAIGAATLTRLTSARCRPSSSLSARTSASGPIVIVTGPDKAKRISSAEIGRVPTKANDALGPGPRYVAQNDAVALIEGGARVPEILVDVGDPDPFIENELRPELLEAAFAKAGSR